MANFHFHEFAANKDVFISGRDCPSAAHRLYSSSPYRMLLSLRSLLRPTLLLSPGTRRPLLCSLDRRRPSIASIRELGLSLSADLYSVYLGQFTKPNGFPHPSPQDALSRVYMMLHKLCILPYKNFGISRHKRSMHSLDNNIKEVAYKTNSQDVGLTWISLFHEEVKWNMVRIQLRHFQWCSEVCLRAWSELRNLQPVKEMASR